MTDDQRSDSELLAGLPHQPELMGVLYERHALAVYRYLARRAGPVAGEDLLSEVFIAALSARTRVVGHHSGSALPWLYGIALNVLRRCIRHSQPAGAADPGPGMDWDAVDARLDAEAQRRASIPGVRLAGHDVDALGRTGTAVERGGETLVIDPGNGQLLADIDGNPNAGLSCGYGCVTYGVAYTYVSEGPARSPPAGQ
jgi:DNA-directed RNA polymerase specialized sigma24 family protein